MTNSLSPCKFESERFFVYNPSIVEQRIRAFRNAFEKNFRSFELAYSVKTNYFPCVLDTVISQGVTPEIVSQFELQMLRFISYDGAYILNGPIKTEMAIIDSLENGSVVNIDSLSDWRKIRAVLDRSNITKLLKICIRLNLNESNLSTSRFGIQPNSDIFHIVMQEIEQTDACALVGFHLHLPDRGLESFADRAHAIRIILERQLMLSPEEGITVNLGGGFRSEMPSSLSHLNVDLHDYAIAIVQGLGSDLCKKIHLILEPGTSIVAGAFDYYTKIIEIKNYGDTNDIFVNGSIFDYSAKALSKAFDYFVINLEQNSAERVNGRIVGYTCIEDDILLDDVDLIISRGDYLRIKGVGSYSLVMRPNFIFERPAIYQVDENYNLRKVHEPQSVADLLRGYYAN